MSRTLKWSAGAARGAKVVDAMGMWIVDDGANVATCQTRISKSWKMFHALAPLLMNKSGALPARPKMLEITMLASFTWGCDVESYNNKELQRHNATNLEMVCGMARSGRQQISHGYTLTRRYHNAKTILCQVEQRQAVEIAFSKFWRFVGDMARWRQRALMRDGTAVIATVLNLATMQHCRMHKSKWRISWNVCCGRKNVLGTKCCKPLWTVRGQTKSLSWMTIARVFGWWSTPEASSGIRQCMMACKLRLLTGIDAVLMI